MMKNDTICAISSPPGSGAIGIIRISGEEAIKILDKVFVSNAVFKSGQMRHGFIVDGEEKIDEVMAVGFDDDKTYTGEFLAEIFPHGGRIPMMEVLSAVLDCGARPAEPGEFTKRAFLNGKMDLSEAEAVMDFIGSVSKLSAKTAFDQLEGKLSDKIKAMQNELTDMLAMIEAGIEYPEEDLEKHIKNKCLPKLDVLIENGAKLEKTFESGKYLKEGFNVCIIGKPNVGKSSLLNALIGKEKAIVTEVAGTTRDVIEELFDINGIPVRYFDTAGIRKSDDLVESIGVEKTMQTIEKANLVLFVIDGSQVTDKRDDNIYELISKKHVVMVLNKSDKKINMPNYKMNEIVKTCALSGSGLDELEDRIYHGAVKGQEKMEGIIITNERHRQILKAYVASLNGAREAFLIDMDLDCVSIDIKDAWNSLGEITGVNVTEEIVNRIFENFCLGK